MFFFNLSMILVKTGGTREAIFSGCIKKKRNYFLSGVTYMLM